MDTVKILSGVDAIQSAIEQVEIFLKSRNKRVLQIIGKYGIGKRQAVLDLLEQNGIVPKLHNYTVIETSQPFEKSIEEHPDSVHLWNDVFRSNIMNQDIYSFFTKLANNKIRFDGKFILIINEAEFPDNNYPELPGMHISMNTKDILSHIEKNVENY